MALNKGPRGRWPLRLHFLARLAGLTGLLAAGAGLILASPSVDLASWESWRATVAEVRSGEAADPTLRLALSLVLVGGAIALLTLAGEALLALRNAAGRRSAFGLNATVQVALALVLLVGLNLYSYHRYLRLDWTRSHQFTLPADIRQELRQLRGETTIVVYQRHKTFGQLSDKPDAYDYAAERKVVEKVKDLVEQFREFGPQFRVVVLDVEEEGFTGKLAELKEVSPDLAAAIDAAPENSIFFFAKDGGKIQRLSFNEFYQLDKTSSQEANDGKGNLVLLYQGTKPFTRKVLNVDEKKPRVAVAVPHEVLGLESSSELGMPGVKKALVARGFDTRDVILKKWSEFGPPEPAVLTYDENKLDQLDQQIAELENSLKSDAKQIQAWTEEQKKWQTAPLKELPKTQLAKQFEIKEVNEALRKEVLQKLIEPNLSIMQLVKEQNEEELQEIRKSRSGVARVEETLAEQRRISDLKAKTERVLADCDLLIVPRQTLINAARRERIPMWVYRQDKAQADAVQEFLRAGKPVLFCFGPINEEAGRSDPMESGPDDFEKLLEKLGIKAARQTVLFNVETKSFGERRGGLIIFGAPVEPPPVKLDFEPGTGQPGRRAISGGDQDPNPIQQSLRLIARSLGKDQPLDLRLRNPRPLYFEPGPGLKLAYAPEFMLTDERSWNEEQPFPSRDQAPRYDPPKGQESVKPAWERERLGPFPIGIAVEVPVPANGAGDAKAATPTVRVAVIGHGGLFTGSPLPPIREKLLLDVCNWLLGRDDLLTRGDQVWQYPRVHLTPAQQVFWHWGTFLGLPGLFAYLGLAVLLVRRMR